jgi:hypothetical protein
MIIGAKRQYQHTRFYSRTGRCRPDFATRRTSKDSKLALTVTASASRTRLARVPNPPILVGADCHLGKNGHTATAELGPQKGGTVVYDLSATVYCI